LVSCLVEHHQLPAGFAQLPSLQVGSYLEKLRLAFAGLLQGALRLAAALRTSHTSAQEFGSGAAVNNNKALPQHMAQLASNINMALAAFDANTASLIGQVAVLRERALPPAEALSQVLWQHWQQPELQRAAQLELAQAAATRCCAYLRCAQLGAQGGPAASDGVGSKRCTGCRVAWYCGTACSHADWRAGHSKVCKALAALQAGGDK
jgi:hypothetical protein